MVTIGVNRPEGGCLSAETAEGWSDKGTPAGDDFQSERRERPPGPAGCADPRAGEALKKEKFKRLRDV